MYSQGSNSIPLYIDNSPDWVKAGNPNQKIPYNVDATLGVNEYVFGRTTPNNDFIVATGFEKNAHGIEMIGGLKRKTKKSSTKKSKKSSIKKSSVKKATVKKATVKKATVKKSPVKKATIKKSPVKKATVKKATVKKTTVKKATK